MSIQSDRWIIAEAAKGMIEPFENSQVRSGVISYGVSSYGYDMRVAGEFKIFTNVLSSIVDPKAFDPKSFVEFEGDVCIVPPNSFALARSVEYFRIPRDVVTLCVGKSTYARCFSGGTHVALVDGTTASLEAMARRASDGEIFWGYGLGPHGRIVVALLEAPRYIGRDSLMELTLDNGALICCTPDHGMVARDGRTVAAAELRPGDSLMPLYRRLVRGSESVYQPLNGHVYPTHRLADEWNVDHGVYPGQPGTHRRRRDRDARNNVPWNIERMPASERFRAHNAESYRPDFDAAEQGAATSDALARRGEDPAALEARSRQSREAWARDDGNRLRNHKIVRVRDLPGDHDVYCLTVPETGNFALAAGVFVANCGVITNVTPFEPEWEGFVTLEISNTTPLPAKIYANEGIAQVMFFRGSEPPITSYKDKQGKYQGQRGVTLPRL